MNSGEKVKHGALWSVLFAVVSLAWIFPIVLVLSLIHISEPTRPSG